MVKKSRRHFTPEQKAAIVRRHLVDKVPVSDLCDEYKIQPSMLYTWQKAVVDGAARERAAEGKETEGAVAARMRSADVLPGDEVDAWAR